MLDYQKFVSGVHDYIGQALSPLVERLKAVEAREPIVGEKGVQGDPGEAGTQGEVGPAGERGEKGDPGETGAQGEKGDPGEQGPAGPAGAQGEKGLDGTHGRDGRDGLPGVQGEKGLDGTHGRDGIDGKDGLGFDDLSVESDEDGNVKLKFVRGDQVKEFAIRLPVFKDMGVFREETDYLKGHGTTFGGSFWIAQKDAPQGKPGLSDDWRLAVKRGRDGKDGSPGEKGAPGRDGKDLRVG